MSRAFNLCLRILFLVSFVVLLEQTTTWILWRTHAEWPFSIIDSLLSGEAILGKTSVATKSNITKTIVVASTSKERTGWVNARNFPGWKLNVYVTDEPSANSTVPHHTGRESSVYLTYIINHYRTLPDLVVFLHAQRYQWHNDDPMYDGIPPIKNLRPEHVLEVGYASLRCVHAPQCPIGLTPKVNGKDGFWQVAHTYADAFQTFFPNDVLPEAVGAPCCAQFAVSKEAIQKRSPAEYELMRRWVWTSGAGEYRNGQVFEMMWHYIFGKEAVHCPSADECYCKMFGHCDLKCPRAPRKCEGRFQPPPPLNTGFPKGWPNKGAGTKGWPENRWWETFYPLDVFDENMKLRNGSRTPEAVYPSE